MNIDIIPKMGSETAREKHKANEDRWKLFSRKMQKSPFMKDFVISKNNNKCAWCGKPSKKFILHHTDYDHLCIYSEPIQISSPTEKRPNRKIKVSDCGNCKLKTPEAFEECSKRVVPVHQYCNKLIDDEMQKRVF